MALKSAGQEAGGIIIAVPDHVNRSLAKLTFGASVAASAATGARLAPSAGTPIGEWYRQLNKPPFNPPDEVFGPVWTALYAAMALSGYRVWRSAKSPRARNRALLLWSAQLAVNGAWSPLFFGARRPGLAFADLVTLLALLAAYTHEAAKVDRSAAWLFAPYIAWVSFAGVLNFEIVRRNP